MHRLKFREYNYYFRFRSVGFNLLRNGFEKVSHHFSVMTVVIAEAKIFSLSFLNLRIIHPYFFIFQIQMFLLF